MNDQDSSCTRGQIIHVQYCMDTCWFMYNSTISSPFNVQQCRISLVHVQAFRSFSFMYTVQQCTVQVILCTVVVFIVHYLGNNCSWIDVDTIPYSMREPRMTTINNEPYLFGGYYVSFIISSFVKKKKSKICHEFK